jgi:hypothetical protein
LGAWRPAVCRCFWRKIAKCMPRNLKKPGFDGFWGFCYLSAEVGREIMCLRVCTPIYVRVVSVCKRAWQFAAWNMRESA